MEKKGQGTPGKTGYWYEYARDVNEEIERKREQFVRNVAQRETGIEADREKFPKGIKTGSPKKLFPNKNKEE